MEKTLYQKLHEIQTVVVGLGKDRASNSYRYVTGSKVLEHIKPLMNKLGLILKQEILSIDNERQDYKTGIGTDKEKPKSEILTKVMMRFTWIDVTTGEKDENLFGANGQNEWEKGLGSALTYAERYFLLKYFHIATDEDDIDNPERKEEEKRIEEERLKAEEEKAKEHARLTELNKKLVLCKTIDDLQKEWDSLNDSDKKIFQKLVTELKAKLTNK